MNDYMCPNCVTPWKCNGPHIPEPYIHHTGCCPSWPCECECDVCTELEMCCCECWVCGIDDEDARIGD